MHYRPLMILLLGTYVSVSQAYAEENLPWTEDEIAMQEPSAKTTPAAHKETNSWDTDFGRMSLNVAPDGNVTGDYPNYKGKVKGHVTKDGLIEAVWYQPSSKRKCDTMEEGSHYWGRVNWKVVDAKYLRGGWAYCDDPIGSGGAWNGDKPSVGKAFASFFSTLLRFAGGVAAGSVGGGIGGTVAGMAISHTTDAAASAVKGAD